MKRILVTLGLVTALMMVGVLGVKADEPVVINLFYLATCPHCHEEIKFLDEYVKEGGIEVNFFEVSNSRNSQLWNRVGIMVGAEVGSVPLTVIGDQFILGFDKAETTGEEIKELVKKAQVEDWPDLIGQFNEKDTKSFDDKVNDWKNQVTEKKFSNEVTVFGKKINLDKLSLPMLTLVVGLVDGFNPCAMWILIFLISLLINMNNRLKMWVLGLTFILVSGVMYFLMMVAWLNLFLLVGLIVWVRYTVGLFSLGVGGWQVKLWWQGRGGGCETSEDGKRQKLFSRLKKVVYEDKLWLAILGIGALAFGINLFELMCSAGLPAVFTNILSMNHLPSWQHYLYIFGYIILYMIDDLAVFVIAMITLKSTGIQSKYAGWAKLIGGIVMIWIGYAMLFHPEKLAF